MARITITRGLAYDLSIIIKEPEAITPSELTGTAIATMYIIDKSDNSQLLTLDMDRTGLPEDGSFLASFTADDTLLFPFEYGFEEDGSNPTSTCRGHVHVYDEFNTNPAMVNIDAIIPDIYIADIGITV